MQVGSDTLCCNCSLLTTPHAPSHSFFQLLRSWARGTYSLSGTFSLRERCPVAIFEVTSFRIHVVGEEAAEQESTIDFLVLLGGAARKARIATEVRTGMYSCVQHRNSRAYLYIEYCNEQEIEIESCGLEAKLFSLLLGVGSIVGAFPDM